MEQRGKFDAIKRRLGACTPSFAHGMPPAAAGHREPTAAPRFDVELGILIGAIFAFLVLQAIPDLQAWVRGEPPTSALESCRAEAAAHAKVAARHAAVVTKCLNAGHCVEAK